MEKVINRMINDAVEGVDTYKTKDSTWIIFTESKKWVIELTKDGTLWYNYNFFNDLMMYLSMDVVENQHYITKWVEDNVINKVKYTTETSYHRQDLVEDTIQNGVKETRPMEGWVNSEKIVDKTIQNGVKNTLDITNCDFQIVEDVIKEGVKHTEYGDWLDGDERFDDIIENGIKETHDDAYHHTGRVEGVIKNGVKQCIPSHTPLYNPMDFSVQYRENHRLDDVASVLEKGIKEVQPLPSQEGNMDYSNYYYRQGDKTIPHTQYVDDVITNGIKKTKAMDEWVNTDRIVDGVISGGSLIR